MKKIWSSAFGLWTLEFVRQNKPPRPKAQDPGPRPNLLQMTFEYISFVNPTNFAIRHRVKKTTEVGLVRGIRRWDLVAIAINGIIGAGIFGLPSKVYALIGTYSLIAFVVCALVVTLIILCFAEVGSRFNETGGPYLYAREAFGPAVAFEIG